ncbi:MAG: hypothetical protein K0R98_1896, partial [Rickettsiaceae bacterium]|nr:hypothetical protein [Rickettsiaceae bacterium]
RGVARSLGSSSADGQSRTKGAVANNPKKAEEQGETDDSSVDIPAFLRRKA